MVIFLAVTAIAFGARMTRIAASARDALEEGFDAATFAGMVSADSLRAVEILTRGADEAWLARLPDMPSGGRRLKVDRSIRIGCQFNDQNPVHLASAMQAGIDPIESTAAAWPLRVPVVKVESCADYYVDSLAHSLPYLVPDAERLLRSIGSTFRDTLAARGGGDYRVKVTSLLRTPATVRRLRRRNRNAVERSAHLYATTFDISYSNFVCNSDTVARTTEDLKLLLAEILRDFQEKDYCWVKHERKQSCFHITVRP